MLIGLAILVPVIGLVLWLLFSNLDSIVARVIENVGSEVLQTEVNVRNVDVDLANGKAGISGLTIANPDGYSEPYIFAMDKIVVGIDIKSLGNSPIVINEIIVRDPKVSLELDKTGRSNLSVLKDNINRSSKSGADKETNRKKDQQTETKETKQTLLIIKKFSFERGQLSLLNQIKPDKKTKVELPVIRLQSIGQAKGGATGSEIAVEMMTKLLAQITLEAAKAHANEALGKEKQKLTDKAGEAIKGLFE